MPVTARQALRDLVRSGDLKYDPWGTALQHLFAICDVLSVIDPDAIPAEWEFHHGAYFDPSLDEMAEGDDTPTVDYAVLARSGSATSADLVSWGNVLDRFKTIADKAGRSY